ncbi:MAG TPA: LacI family DNA-binding transcriptional regulator [Micromonosporaceae bacterium]|nr:LacI family DNA-binding transcriptional regulator [Micromonosporaceae bacterium]
MVVTLQTIADAVGVSRSTVSNAYSRPDQLSAEMREKILETARRLGYPGPDPVARSLRRGRVGAIGVLFTSALSYAFTDPYAVQFLRGLSEAAERHDNALLLLPLCTDDEAAANAVRNAVVDAFCVYCLPDWHRSLAAARDRGLPLVRSELSGDNEPNTAYVGIDEAAATRLAGEHIVRLGHRRIAVIAEWFETDRQTRPVVIDSPDEIRYYVTRERLRGYQEAFRAAGIAWTKITAVNAAHNSRESGAAAAACVLDSASHPTAILAASDLLALGVLDALAARGLRPGRDVSVVGFDDIPEAAATGLTTIRQPAIERGRIAGTLLLDPTAYPDRRIVLPTELVVRTTTGPSPNGSN